jgi:hypothetical protein
MMRSRRKTARFHDAGASLVGRLGLCVCLCIGSAAQVRPASAEDPKAECLSAYDAGQRLRKARKLTSAVEKLLFCGGPACPAAMHRDCQGWLDEVRAALPSVVLRAFSPSGELLLDTQVSIDGAETQPLDGHAIELDPGRHELRFEHPGYVPKLGSVFIAEGEKLESRDVILERVAAHSAEDWTRISEAQPSALVKRADSTEPGSPMATPTPLGARAEPTRSAAVLSPPADGPGPLAWMPLALGAATGVAGTLGFAYFGLAARHGEHDLDRCSPNCAARQIDDVKRDYLLANVSLGAGLIGWVATGALLLLRGPDHPNSSTLSGPKLGADGVGWEGSF